MQLGKQQARQLHTFLSRCHSDQYDAVQQMVVQHLRPGQSDSIACLLPEKKTEPVKILLSAIAYFESRGHALFVHPVKLKEDSPLLRVAKGGLKECEALLRQQEFVKVHKSFMVNMHCISRFGTKRQVHLINNAIVQGGKIFISTARQEYADWMFS